MAEQDAKRRALRACNEEYKALLDCYKGMGLLASVTECYTVHQEFWECFRRERHGEGKIQYMMRVHQCPLVFVTCEPGTLLQLTTSNRISCLQFSCWGPVELGFLAKSSFTVDGNLSDVGQGGRVGKKSDVTGGFEAGSLQLQTPECTFRVGWI